MPDSDNTQTAALGGVGSIRVAASQFLRWVHVHGALAPDAHYPGEGVGDPNFGEIISGAALATLRQRQVRMVGINEASRLISVFLRRAAPTAKELRSLPKACNGFDVRYFQGNPSTVSPAAIAQAATACAIHHTAAGSQVYTCGSSISVGNDRSAGTLGCLLRDAANELYGLSNNHVSGSCNYAPVGLPVIAPGVADVSPFNPHPFTLGIHTKQLPMLMGDPTGVDYIKNTDAAVFKLTQSQLVSSMQRDAYDTPSTVGDLVAGLSVDKVGRTTGHTRGVVQSEIVGAVPVSYSASQYQFNGVVYFEPLFIVHGVGDVFSEAGDSGSLVTTVDLAGQRHAVGIVVAGCDDSAAPGGKRTLVLPLRPILDSLQMTLVSGHNL